MPVDETNNFLNGKPAISYVINFGNKDKDIWIWAESVPKGRFSLIVKDMLRAYYTHDDNYIPPIFKKDIEVIKPFRKCLSLGKADYDVYKIISQFEDQLISFQIKEVIRYYVTNDNRTNFTDTIKKNNASGITNYHSIKDNSEEEHEMISAQTEKKEYTKSEDSESSSNLKETPANQINSSTESINQRDSMQHLLNLADQAKFKK